MNLEKYIDMTSKRQRCYFAPCLAMLMCAIGSFDCARAQTTAPQQYVIIYGELAAKHNAQGEGELLLRQLADIAKHRFGAEYFTVSFELGRPGAFNITEVWKDAEAYASFSGSSSVRKFSTILTTILLAPLDERDGNSVSP